MKANAESCITLREKQETHEGDGLGRVQGKTKMKR